MSRLPARTASFIITFLGATSNLAVALQILASWRSFKWEPESEWESSGDKWAVDGIQVIWGILLAYFSAASLVSAIGFAGIVKSKPALVKFYRDYSIADFAFCAFITLIVGYGSSLSSAPVGACEGLARQPELMRNMAEIGLSAENCERWLRRAVFALLALMLIVLVARLHFLLAVGIYYSHLSRFHSQRTSIPMTTTSMSHTRPSSHSSRSGDSVQRVYLLPRNVPVPGVTTPTSPLSSNGPASANPTDSDSEDIVMYTPVPLHALSREEALDLRRNATETWVKTAKPEGEKSARSSHSHSRSHSHSYSHSHSHRHRHHHSYSHAAVMNGTGQISLPIQPDEGLLPGYSSESKDA